MGQTLKNLFHWRYLLSYKRVLIPILIIFIINFIHSQEQANNFIKIRNIHVISTNEFQIQNKLPKIFENNIEKKEIKINDNFFSNILILTYKFQEIELIIYKNSVPIGAIYLSENSDLKFVFDNEEMNIYLNYGRARFVIEKPNKLNIFLNTTKIETEGTDFGVLSLVNEKDNSRYGYVIVFDGSVKHTSLNDSQNSEMVEQWYLSKFYENKVYPKEKFDRASLFLWQTVQSFKDLEKAPQNIPFVLEYLKFEETDVGFKKEEEEETGITFEQEKSIDVTTDLTTDKKEQVVKKKEKFDYLKFLTSFFSVELGSIAFNNNIGAKIISRPGINLFDDKFEFGFYFFLTIIPSKVFTGNMIMSINNRNNEWSFGSDQGGIAEKIVFDIFDDILLKLRILRYNRIEDKIFIQVGEYNNISDRFLFSMNDFNSKIFFPIQRKTSFVNSYNLPFFQALIYAEDILPKGLYNISLFFSNPSKSFKFRGGLSAYIDCYDLIKFGENEESYFPAQFNAHFEFVAFDLPTYWFSLHLNGGILLPFSYNFVTNASQLSNMINQNPSSIAAGMAFDFGIQWRVKGFSFLGEIIVDSDINKVGIFDISYSAKRDNRKNELSLWLTNLTNNSLSISAYNFGCRVKFKIEPNKYILIEPAYQLTFGYSDNPNITFFDIYYDKFYFKLLIDSKEKLKINVLFLIQWQIESLITTIYEMTQSNFNRFLTSNILYIGLTLKPHKTVDISLNGGIFPDFNNPGAPVQFLIDINASFKPQSLTKQNKK